MDNPKDGQAVYDYVKSSSIANDEPTKAAHLGWRVVYTFFAWIILGHGIVPGTGFFVASCLFATPIFMEYFRFMPQGNIRYFIRLVSMAYLSIILLMSAIGMAGILNVVAQNNDLYIRISDNFIILRGSIFQLDSIWYSISGCVILTVIDWVLYEAPFAKCFKSGEYGHNT